MKYFSTFSGIGGFEIGIQKAIANKIKPEKQSTECPVSELGSSTDTPNSDGNWWGSSATCVGYSEIDKYAIKVYERHFNDTKNYGDITKINADTLPDFDCLVGGFPCQTFSIAGKRKGFDDTRGTLFFDLARILRAKQPRLFVFENVKGLLSHDNGQTFATIISTLTELGYDCQWQVLNSKNHGVPQNRERVIIVGHLRGTSRPKVFPIGLSGEQTGKAVEVAGTLETDGWEKRFEQIRRVHSTDGISPTIPTGTGGGVMTKIVAQRGRDVNGKWTQQLEARPDDLSNTLTAVQKDNMVACDLTRRAENNHRVRKDGRAGTLDANYYKGLANQERPGATDGVRIRRLTPIECERLQGFPDNWTALGIGDEPISDSQRYKMCGNAVTVNVIQAVFERIFNSIDL